MSDLSKFPKKETVLKWTGWVICACSSFAVVLLLIMKFILKQEAYISDMLIFAGIALVGYAMADGYEKKQKVQEDSENEQQ